MENQTEQHGDPDKMLNSKLEREKAEQKRTRTVAIVFGLIVTLALVALTYGFVQKRSADERVKLLQASSDSLKLKLEECAQMARMQQMQAHQAAIQAHEAQRQAEEALRKHKK